MISEDRILGFVEGEGCFNIGISKIIDRKPRKTERKNKRKPILPFRVVPNFRIALAEPDRKILEEVKETFGFGEIYTQKRSEKDPNTRNVCYYYIKNFEEAKRIKEFFKNKQFLTTKGNDFQQWCKCLEIIENGQHLTKEGLLEICKIRDQMNNRKNKNSRTFELVQKVIEANPEHIEAHKQNHVHNQNPTLNNWFTKKMGKNKFILETPQNHPNRQSEQP